MDYDKFLGTLVEIKNQYNQGIHGDEMLPVDLARLVSIVGQRVNLPIEFKAANWGASKIKGALLRYKDRATIIYSSSLNPCWERFVICKELSHLLLDGNDAYTTDPEDLVQNLVGVSLLRPDHVPTDPEMSEYLAVIAAIELLFPINYRRELYRAYVGRELSLYQIATIFRIPERHVEQAFSEGFREGIDTVIYAAIQKNAAEGH